MTAAVSAAPRSDPADPEPTPERRLARRPRVRHTWLAAALAVVALLRAGSGDWVWAGVLGAGALAEVGVALLERRRAAASAAPSPAPSARVLPGPSELARALAAHRQATRTWTAVTLLALVVAGVLLVTEASLALVVAVVAVAALFKRRRAHASTTRLEALLAASDPDRDSERDGDPE